MLRVSTTTLEAFRRVVATDYGDEAELIAQLSGRPVEPTWQMRAGTAWQAVLTSPYRHEQTRFTTDGLPWQSFECGGYRFPGCDLWPAVRHLGPGVSEVKAVRTLDAFGVPVDVVAQADFACGLVIQENKVKFSPPNPADYDQSLQWRFYLLVHGAECLRYNLWHFKDPEADGYCELKEVVSFRCWPYEGLELECRRWLAEFLEWCHRQKLTRFLDRSGSTVTAEAAA